MDKMATEKATRGTVSLKATRSRGELALMRLDGGQTPLACLDLLFTDPSKSARLRGPCQLENLRGPTLEQGDVHPMAGIGGLPTERRGASGPPAVENAAQSTLKDGKGGRPRRAARQGLTTRMLHGCAWWFPCSRFPLTTSTVAPPADVITIRAVSLSPGSPASVNIHSIVAPGSPL